MDIKYFSDKIGFLRIAVQQIKKLAKELNAISISTNSSTSLNTTFMIILKKEKCSLYDVELWIDIDFGKGIRIYGQNLEIYKELDVTKPNILNLCTIIKKRVERR